MAKTTPTLPRLKTSHNRCQTTVYTKQQEENILLKIKTSAKALFS
jgi:hypothetical protein